MKIVSSVIIVSVYVYFLAAFANASLNPAEWTENARWCWTGAMASSAVITIIVLNAIDTKDEKEENR